MNAKLPLAAFLLPAAVSANQPVSTGKEGYTQRAICRMKLLWH
ncbi:MULTISPECIES: hypothetical protein [Aquitalea]|nr:MULTISPECIES: hypothetical protein [Aquitalea]